MIYWQLYISFCQIGLFCIGGGYASMPLIQEQVVTTHGWMTLHELIDVFAISQMTPGPIGINAATFVGTRIAGIGGSIVATLGFVTPSVIIMVILAKLFAKYGEVAAIRGVLNGVRPAVVALIGSAGLTFVTILLWQQESGPYDWSKANVPELLFLVGAFLVVRYAKLGVIKLLSLCGLIGLIMGYLGYIQ